jgi:hypothetical protein
LETVGQKLLPGHSPDDETGESKTPYDEENAFHHFRPFFFAMSLPVAAMMVARASGFFAMSWTKSFRISRQSPIVA